MLQYLYGAKLSIAVPGASSAAPEQTARLFLDAYPALLGLDAAKDTLVLEKIVKRPAGGAYVRLSQKHEGVPCDGAFVTVMLDGKAHVRGFVADVYPIIAASPAPGDRHCVTERNDVTVPYRGRYHGWGRYFYAQIFGFIGRSGACWPVRSRPWRESLFGLVDLLDRRQRRRAGADVQAEQWATRHGLSPTETRVLVFAVRGVANADIAQTLGCSAHTIRTHWKRIYDKAGLHSRLEIIAAVIG